MTIKRIFILILSIYIVLISLNVYVNISDKVLISNMTKSVVSDLSRNYNYFDSAVNLFEYGKYKKITSENFDEENEALCVLFEKLGYKEIYTDCCYNVYFNKYGNGLKFVGLLFCSHRYAVYGEYDIIKKDENTEWAFYYNSFPR